MAFWKRKKTVVAADTELRLLFAEAQESIEEGASKLRQANELLEASIQAAEEKDDSRGVPGAS
jgi:hypothetical protein